MKEWYVWALVEPEDGPHMVVSGILKSVALHIAADTLVEKRGFRVEDITDYGGINCDTQTR